MRNSAYKSSVLEKMDADLQLPCTLEELFYEHFRAAACKTTTLQS